MSDKKTMSAEECLAESGELFKKAQYQKCKELLLEYHSSSGNYASSEHTLHDDDDFEAHSSQKSNSISNSSIAINCIFEQNIHVCTFMTKGVCRKSCVGEIKLLCESFNSLLQAMTDWTISENHIGVELIILHNYLVIHMSQPVSDLQEWSENGFMLIATVLSRALEAITGISASIYRPTTAEEICSVLDGIFVHSESMTDLTLEALSTVCYTVFFLLLSCDIIVPMHHMKKIMSKIKVTSRIRKKLKHRGQSFVCLSPSNLVKPDAPCHNDLMQLLLACHCMAANEVHTSYLHLEEITCTGWKHFVGYMKAFLLFKEKQYDEALESCWTLWKTKQTAESWTVARLSNLIGCCFFKKCCYNFSLQWFQKSVNSDFTCLFPLWNLASTFQRLGKDDASLRTLKVLEQASVVNSDEHNNFLFCNMLWLQDRPGINHVQALYLLAHQSLLCRRYSVSAEHFRKILCMLKETPLKNSPHSVHFPISLSDIFVEACYAYLHAGRYEDCLEASNSASEFFPSCNCCKKRKTSFSCSDTQKVLKKSPSNSNAKHSPSVTDSLDVFSVSNDIVDLLQTDSEHISSLYLGNENDEVPMNSESSKTKTDEKIPCTHDHVKLHRAMHLMIEASAKYSLNCNSESCDILRRALSVTMHHQGIEDDAEKTVLEEKDHSVENFSKESCPACSNCISSLCSQIYNNLAVIDISENHLKKAAHNLRLAVLHDSGNIDAIYNYCLLQIKLKQVDTAQAFWESSKDRCDKLRSIITTDDYCDSICTVTNASLKSLNEAFLSSN